MDLPRILEQHGEITAVYKPSGWVVHAAQPNEPADLQAWLKEQGLGALHPAHRLDRGTSGAVLYSADPAERTRLGAAFAEGRVKKRYLAMAYGRTRPKGVIRKRLSDGRRGKPLDAVTRYRTLGQAGYLSLIAARPETGRKHQIRRHLHAIGHPLLGDSRYRKKSNRPVAGAPERLWLHASSLEIDDWRIVCPLPSELEAHLQELGLERR